MVFGRSSRSNEDDYTNVFMKKSLMEMLVGAYRIYEILSPQLNRTSISHHAFSPTSCSRIVSSIVTTANMQH